MSIIPTTGSGVTKMIIKSYENVDFSSSANEIKAQINPEKLSVKYGLEYNGDSGSTDANAVLPQAKYTLPSLEMELVLDDTGVLSTELKDCGSGVTDIETYIALLKKVVYNYVEATHGPPFVSIEWGSVKIESTNLPGTNPSMFKGQLSDFSVEYSLFSKSGKPVQAKVSMGFKAMMDPEYRPTGQSPDLTHIHQIQTGDNLPMLSQKIYNKPTFYMQLARVNGLSSVYQLKPGLQLVIPPLEKSSR